jgi:hypothetical protein
MKHGFCNVIVQYKWHVIVNVPDTGTGCCLDPEGNGAGLGEGGEAGPGPPEWGKDRQLKPSEGRDNTEKDEEEQPIQT